MAHLNRGIGMNLSAFHRGGVLARVLSLLLLCNGFLHLCFHEHLGEAGGRIRGGVCHVAADAHDHDSGLTAEVFCPCCAAVIDWWCADSPTPERLSLPTGAELPRAFNEYSHDGAALFRSRAPPLA